ATRGIEARPVDPQTGQGWQSARHEGHERMEHREVVGSAAGRELHEVDERAHEREPAAGSRREREAKKPANEGHEAYDGESALDLGCKAAASKLGRRPYEFAASAPRDHRRTRAVPRGLEWHGGR